MCGRYTISVNRMEMGKYLENNYEIEAFDESIELPRYNVSPGQNVLSVICDGKKYRAGLLKWGFVPDFAKDEGSGYKMINARAETLSEKPAFINSFKHRRCVVLADGFYEWLREGKKKTPYRFLFKNNAIFPMAGLWSTFTRPDGTKLHSCTIITTTANSIVTPVHDRMPVILSEEMQKIWLDPEITNLRKLSGLLVPSDDEALYSYLVSSAVNNTTNDNPDCIKAIDK